MFKSFDRLLAFACCGALLGSCAPSKISQCRQAIDLANVANSRAVSQALSETSTRRSQATDTKDLLQAAEILASAGEELRALQLRDSQLQTWQTEYAGTYSELAAATHELVEAIDRRDREVAERARDRLETASSTEESLVRTINDYCLSETP